jgi:hypothetical protein
MLTCRYCDYRTAIVGYDRLHRAIVDRHAGSKPVHLHTCRLYGVDLERQCACAYIDVAEDNAGIGFNPWLPVALNGSPIWTDRDLISMVVPFIVRQGSCG